MSGIEYLWYNRDGTPRITGFLQSAIDKMAADIQQKVDELNAECGFTSAHVVEGTITVIDSDVLALPAPTTVVPMDEDKA